jgi:hypothetical protein
MSMTHSRNHDVTSSESLRCVLDLDTIDSRTWLKTKTGIPSCHAQSILQFEKRMSSDDNAIGTPQGATPR